MALAEEWSHATRFNQRFEMPVRFFRHTVHMTSSMCRPLVRISEHSSQNDAS